LSGLASGVLLLGDQPFQTGDWISVGDIEGLVVDINWRTSRIQTRNGDVIVVPNSELASSQILNFTDEQPLHRIVFPVQVAFANAPSLAKDMLLDAARGTPGVLSDPPPQVLVVQVDDPLMGYEVHLWVADYSIVPRVTSDFGSLVWYQSHRHNVPLPSPAQDLYLWDGPTAGIDEASSPANVRAALARSPLLGSLPDDELDRLVQATRTAQFATGEIIARSDGDRRTVVLLDHGEAELRVLTTAPGSDEPDELVVATLSDGDVVIQLAAVSVGGDPVVVRAQTDCRVLLVDGAVAGEVGSRHGDLAAAIGRTTSTWRRRIERLRERRDQQLALVATDRLLDEGVAAPAGEQPGQHDGRDAGNGEPGGEQGPRA
jgi:CRP-like cAMP-binding protein